MQNYASPNKSSEGNQPHSSPLTTPKRTAKAADSASLMYNLNQSAHMTKEQKEKWGENPNLAGM